MDRPQELLRASAGEAGRHDVGHGVGRAARLLSGEAPGLGVGAVTSPGRVGLKGVQIGSISLTGLARVDLLAARKEGAQRRRGAGVVVLEGESNPRSGTGCPRSAVSSEQLADEP